MKFNISIPTPTGIHNFSVEPGTSTILVGANGAGKTRLAVFLEQQNGESAHRISAHRTLALNPSVAKISEASALRSLKYGKDLDALRKPTTVGNRNGIRWKQNPATIPLNDFDSLLQALFANQANIALTTHNQVHNNQFNEPRYTNCRYFN